MASVVSICNMALSYIGDSAISALDDNNDRARACNLHYEVQRDACLRAHPWNFAKKREELAQDGTWDDDEWTYAYEIPSDYLRMLSPVENYPGEVPYAVENGLILCNDSTLSIKYIAQITDTGYFDALFTDVLAQRLAATLAMALSKQKALIDMMWNAYKQKLDEARQMDGQEAEKVEFYLPELTAIR